MKYHKWKGFLIAIVLLAAGNFENVAGQIPKPARTAKQDFARQGFSLRISTADLLTVSLKAEKAPLANIASELSKKLQVPVHLGYSVSKLEVTADFKRLMLEPAMHVLAPAVYIDYEIKYAPGEQPRAVGIYLGGYADPPPGISSVGAGNTQVFMIEGNTEDGPEETSSSKDSKEKDKSLQVSYEANSLTVKAKQQPLTVVLARIANELGIPLEIRDTYDDVVDLDLDKLPLEDAVSRLAPNVRLYVRADLQRVQRTPFRLVLVARNKRS